MEAASCELRAPRAWMLVAMVAVLTIVCATVATAPVAVRHDVWAQATAASGAPRTRVPVDTALEELTRQVAAQLRCPVCQGLSLADSPSELALEMKDVVRQQLRAGRSPEEVKAYFVAKYGEWILLEPPRRGINLLAYALPALAIVGGVGVIWLMLRRWTRAAPEPGELPEPDPLD